MCHISHLFVIYLFISIIFTLDVHILLCDAANSQILFDQNACQSVSLAGAVLIFHEQFVSRKYEFR